MKGPSFRCCLPVLLALGSFSVAAQMLSDADRTRAESAVQQVLAQTQAPSASVGIERNGRLIFAEAFGAAALPRNVGVAADEGGAVSISVATEKTRFANTAMAYPIGSVSKQFTAACILLLAEDGKLTLDDPVARWFPNFTRAKEVTVRNLLTHTSGYSDYAPQDYTIPAWTRPVDPLQLATEWATKPLDFEPGTRWQYSNTNFVIAALIVEKASGLRFHDFLWSRVIQPLKLEGVLDLDTDRAKLEVRGYEQHALAPMRPAILEAPGWYYGDAQLAMPVRTLLAWDQSIIDRTLLKPASYEAMETEFKLKDGSSSHYGLAVFVNVRDGKKVIQHAGEVGGFVSNNVVLLTERTAIVALTNAEANSAASRITKALRSIAFGEPLPAVKTASTEPANPPAKPVAETADAQLAGDLVRSLQQGTIDRNRLTPDANFYFSTGTLVDFQTSLEPLGKLVSVQKTTEELRGGMTFRRYLLTFRRENDDPQRRAATLSVFLTRDGKYEQFLIGPAE